MTRRRIAIVAALLCVLLHSGPASGATIIINNLDGPGEGFNDPTAVSPVGGNSGTTLGDQRLIAFQYAADLWGACLESNIVIEVDARMDPQYCDPMQAVLGSAGATFIHRDWTSGNPPPKAGTWYPQALANAIAAVDLNPGTAEIAATFNSNLNGNPACLGGIGWYYGLDENPGGDIDFVTVVFHEIGHGLGFQTFMSSSGVPFQGSPDAYFCNMYHVGTSPPDYPSMNNGQRGACNTGDPNLVWDGANANLVANAVLSSGLTASRVRLHGPNPFQSGSSLSHFSNALSPNEVMEPFYSGPNHDGTMSLALLSDMGWVLIPKGCAAPEIACTDVKEDSLSFPNYYVRLQVENTGAEDAANVSATLCDTLPTLGFVDSTDAYGTIAPGDSSCGSGFVIDLSDWPGGPIPLRVKLSWEDTCGGGYADTVDKVITVTITTDAPTPDAEKAYVLSQNLPNPFNPVTSIACEIPRADLVTIVVYDVNGRRVRTLVNERKDAGAHVVRWNGTDDSGQRVVSGVYFYRMTASRFARTKKMVLLK